MALSEQDRQILEQLERELRREDPHLASTLSSQHRTPVRGKKSYSPRRVGLGVALALAGLVLPIVGISIGLLWVTVLLGVAGFALMVTGVLFIAVPTVENGGVTRPSKPQSSFMERQQQKWDERKNR
ncbi:MAG: DUF3040 domain-containing protein [Actinomycetaceae bacterium]|nr:DUF3040 domain-containing protein [Actinomycetaceae bacterium]